MFLFKKQKLRKVFSVLMLLLLIISGVFVQVKSAKAEDCFKYSGYCAARFVVADTLDAGTSGKCRFKITGDAPDVHWGRDIRDTYLKINIKTRIPGQPDRQSLAKY